MDDAVTPGHLAPPSGARRWLRTRGRIGGAGLTSPRRCVAYLALTAVMYAALDVSLLLVLVLAVPAAGFLVRTFVVFHDCAHGSFLPWRRANHWLGIACGLLVYSPFHSLASRACGASRVSR